MRRRSQDPTLQCRRTPARTCVLALSTTFRCCSRSTRQRETAASVCRGRATPSSRWNPSSPAPPRPLAWWRIPSSRNRKQQTPEQQKCDGQHEQQAVEAIEDAAVPGNDVRAVLDTSFALEQRLCEVAGLGGSADDNREEHSALDRERKLRVRHQNEAHVKEANQDGDRQPPE